jgi:O-antigen/teichoic acid export membrane protein
MLIQHSLVYLVGRLIPGGLSLLGLALYTRLMTAEQYGLYALVLAGVGVINSLLLHWLSLAAGRFLPACRDSASKRQLLGMVVSLFIALVMLTGAVGGLAVWLWPDPPMRKFVFLAVILAWCQGWFDLTLKLVNAQLAPVRYSLISSVKALLALSIGTALLYFGFGASGALLGVLVSLVVSPLLAWKQWQGGLAWHHDVKHVRSLLSYGAPLALTFALAFVVDASDRFFLGFFRDSSQVGTYAAAYDLTQQGLGLLMGIVHLAGFPLAVKMLEEQGEAQARTQVARNGLMLLAIAAPAAAGFAMLANNIATEVLGPAFHTSAVKVIPWVALAVFLGGVKSYYLDYSFQLGRRMSGQLWTVGWAALVNLGLNVVLIPAFGAIGAAWATVGAFAVGTFASWRIGRRVFKVPAPGESWKVFVATAVMAVSVWPTIDWRGPYLLVAQVLLGLSIYLAVLLLVNAGGIRPRVVHDLFTRLAAAHERQHME